MPITKEELDWAVRYFNTANYLAAASIYLKDNFLLKRELKPEHIKDSLLGHWGTCPGINFIYTHLNLLAYKKKQSFLPVVGPGHGFAAILANLFIDGSLRKYYPKYKNDESGLGSLIKSFCWPRAFPSHSNPGVPGVIHEGGELGYALSTAFGAVFDHPNLIAVAIIGDGESETGPTATAWHSNKFLNPKTDGAVLPILHLNGYKISSPTIYGTMSHQELDWLFKGYGYQPRLVGEDHKELYKALEWAYESIKDIQKKARDNQKAFKPKWPLIILKTRKGWTGIKQIDGKDIEGSYRSHQVPVRDVKTNPKSLALLEKWLLSYDPKNLFPKGKVPPETNLFLPPAELRMGDNPYAIGGNFRKPLILPNPKSFAVKCRQAGCLRTSNTSILGKYLAKLMVLNLKNRNFRIFSPDELESNKLDAVLEITKRVYIWPHSSKDNQLSPDGRVMEMLSEHTLQGWLQGYLLTGRHGLFPSYEAFLPIIDSMIAQYLKFIKVSSEYSWRKPVSSLNYLLTSVCWRQDHNGFSHQNPGFINVLLDKAKEERLVRFYFPADANMLLTTIEHALRSTDRVNIIVSDKQLIRQWQTYAQAVKQAKDGISIWEFASDKNPDVVLAACGDYQTEESLAAIKLLKEIIPEIKIRFVNISELNVLGEPKNYPNALSDQKFQKLFTANQEVIFSFHGYPDTIKQLLFDRDNTRRFHIYGYMEAGTTTTPFDLLIQNGVSRYDLIIYALRIVSKKNKAMAKKAALLISEFKEKIKKHGKYIKNYGKDPDEIGNWRW